jgi:hypothetical protein
MDLWSSAVKRCVGEPDAGRIKLGLHGTGKTGCTVSSEILK